MNKADLIDALAQHLGGRAAAGAAVEAMVDVVLREVARGGSVGISGFGTFEQVERAPRTGRNPRTGDAVPIAGTATPRFRPGQYFKDVVADPGMLPEDRAAGVRSSSGERTTPASPSSAGAPASVRRTGPLEASLGEVRGASKGKVGPKGRRADPATSGTPETVRKHPHVEPETPAAPAPGLPGPPQDEAPSAWSGGDEITAGMISAKKAQLARVKVDETAARKKAKKKDAKKKKKKDKKKQ